MHDEASNRVVAWCVVCLESKCVDARLELNFHLPVLAIDGGPLVSKEDLGSWLDSTAHDDDLGVDMAVVLRTSDLETRRRGITLRLLFLFLWFLDRLDLGKLLHLLGSCGRGCGLVSGVVASAGRSRNGLCRGAVHASYGSAPEEHE